MPADQTGFSPTAPIKRQLQGKTLHHQNWGLNSWKRLLQSFRIGELQFYEEKTKLLGSLRKRNRQSGATLRIDGKEGKSAFISMACPEGQIHSTCTIATHGACSVFRKDAERRTGSGFLGLKRAGG